MLRQNGSMIRKRGCSSSSTSSSSVVQNYRFKRAILVGKRGGSSTPVPTWSRSPFSTKQNPDSPTPSHKKGGRNQGPVSARKLAASLWEMNNEMMPSPRQENKRIRSRDRIRSVQSGSFPSHLSDPSHSPPSTTRMEGSVSGSVRRNSAISRRLRYPLDHSFDTLSSASLMEIEMRSRAQTPTGSILGLKTRLKDLSNGLTTSKELLKILNRFWGHEDQHSSTLSLISALRAELERARVQVDQMIQEERFDKHEIDFLIKRFAEEKAVWRTKEKERIKDVVETVAGNLQVERKMRRRSESVTKKLGIELAETKAALSKALKELESEKKARQTMEQVCEELARGIGEEKAEVEELKKESAKAREEVEQEREMLQLADVLREERLQMKLSEAKYQFEEKNAAVDKLRNQLETYLHSDRAKENRIGSLYLKIKAEVENQGEESGHGEGEVEDGEEHEDEVDPEEDDSAESDLHSIELDMDNHRNYRWNYTSGATQEDPKRVSVDEQIKGRKSLTEKNPRQSISLERRNSDGVDWDFHTGNFSNRGDGYDRGRYSVLNNQTRGQSYDVEALRCKAAKGLKDHILSGSRMTSAGGFASPTRQWGQPWPSRDPSNVAREKSAKLRESGLKAKLVEARGGGRSSKSLKK